MATAGRAMSVRVACCRRAMSLVDGALLLVLDGGNGAGLASSPVAGGDGQEGSSPGRQPASLGHTMLLLVPLWLSLPCCFKKLIKERLHGWKGRE